MKGTNPIPDLNVVRENGVKIQIAANRFDSNPTRSLDVQVRIGEKTLGTFGTDAKDSSPSVTLWKSSILLVNTVS